MCAGHRPDHDPAGHCRTWAGSRPWGVSKGIAAVTESVAGLADELVEVIDALEHVQHAAHDAGSVEEEAAAFCREVIPAQNALREVADKLEALVADDLWPLPKYRELLFQY